ncbi:hypothetical protein [Halobacillus naozhouensis]|uniref:PH domain-containing protein n=1 Tax=Halobacillus naozhouensis TaxID=554880 RepID=A0ABY8IZC5_9BACI|nr:hypothetical protein [Halobacillus naozhouensis]WFT74659.1 hypothetical protein P9989_20295 [Halobacillus naozhouensis]
MKFSSQKLLGSIWLAVAVMNIVLIGFDMYLTDSSTFIFILHIITAGSSIYLAAAFMNIHKFSCVRSNDNHLFIRSGLYPREKKIPLSHISKVVEKEVYLQIYCGDKKTAKIHRRVLSD